MKLKLLFFLLISPLLYGQINLNKNIFQLEERNDNLTIKKIITKESQGLFNKAFPLETYKLIKGEQANWICINVSKQNEKQYISIENSIFEELRFYRYKDSKISIPEDLSEQKQYRFPIISITAEQTPCKIFIRSKDAMSYRTEFSIKNYNDASLQKTIQRDYFVIGAFIVSLFVLLISACVFFIYKKQYAVLWYGLHLSVLSIEYLISTGTFSQWIIPNKFVLKYGLDHICLFISVLALSQFFSLYFPYDSKTKFCKKIYLIISAFCVLGILYSLFDAISGNIYNVEWYAQTVLNYASLLSLGVHTILVICRVIPIYLFIAFLLPVLGIFANLGGLKDQFDSPSIQYFIFQSVYLGIIIEVMVIIFYMIKQSIDGELKAIDLSQENNKLKNSFDEQLSFNQENHQNALMNDVHDSFGGYIEALKLTLLNKQIKEKAVDEVLDSFIKDYRLLLNSLHIPNVNTQNFAGAIQEYCTKMNSLSKIDIVFNEQKNSSNEIPQNIAKFIFKAASELTTNAIKYARPNYINVTLFFEKNHINLNVEDNGIGFNETKIKPSSYGISGIRKRTDNFNGQFIIESKLNKGSIITIEIPIPEMLN